MLALVIFTLDTKIISKSYYKTFIPIITNFKKLKKLDISGTKITSDGIKIIKSKLPNCEITSGD